MSSSYDRGFDAGRDGRDPSPPSYNSFLDPLFGVSEKCVDRMESDYKDGFRDGTNQRVADNLEDDDE
jgi:hypothetical protein